MRPFLRGIVLVPIVFFLRQESYLDYCFIKLSIQMTINHPGAYDANKTLVADT